MPRIPSSIQCQRPAAPKRSLRKGLLQKSYCVGYCSPKLPKPFFSLCFRRLSPNLTSHDSRAFVLWGFAAAWHSRTSQTTQTLGPLARLGIWLRRVNIKSIFLVFFFSSFTQHKLGKQREKKAGIWLSTWFRVFPRGKAKPFVKTSWRCRWLPVVHSSWINATGRWRFITFEMTRHNSAGSSGYTVTIMLLLLSRLLLYYYCCCCRKQWSPQDLTAFPDTNEHRMSRNVTH